MKSYSNRKYFSKKKSSRLKLNHHELKSKKSLLSVPSSQSSSHSASFNPLFPSINPSSKQPPPMFKTYPIFRKPEYAWIGKMIDWCHFNIMYLNGSKFFAGVVMILLNVGSKFIPVQFSKSLEEHMKYRLSKPILIFAMAWMATRDIYTSFVLCFIIVLLSDYLLNEESDLCILPNHTRILENNVVTKTSTTPYSKDELNQIIQKLEQMKNAI